MCLEFLLYLGRYTHAPFACIYILPLPTPQDKVLYDTLQLQILSLHIFILVSVVDLAKRITRLIINYNWSTINCGMFWA